METQCSEPYVLVNLFVLCPAQIVYGATPYAVWSPTFGVPPVNRQTPVKHYILQRLVISVSSLGNNKM